MKAEPSRLIPQKLTANLRAELPKGRKQSDSVENERACNFNKSMCN